MPSKSPKPQLRQRRRLATIKDVAAKAGVSIMTVSRVVNRGPRVSADTARRVRSAIRALNYHPNLSARNLVSANAYLIALLYDNPSDNYIVSVLEGVLSAGQQSGYSVLLKPCQYESHSFIEDVLAFVRSSRPSGLILTPPLGDLQRLLKALDRQKIAYVTLVPANENTGKPFVTLDDRAASLELTRYLISRGHRRVGFVKGHPAICASGRRLQGFFDAHREHGLKVDESLIAEGMFTFDSGREAARQLLSLPDRPTAIFASNDDMAAGVLYVAREKGINVPAQLSVAGYDDTPLSRCVYPSLTTVRQPIREMGRAAVQCLLAAVRRREGSDGESSVSRRFDCELVIRDSVGPGPI